MAPTYGAGGGRFELNFVLSISAALSSTARRKTLAGNDLRHRLTRLGCDEGREGVKALRV